MFAYLQLMSILNPHGTRFFILVAIVALVLIIRKIRQSRKELLLEELKPSEKKDLLIGLRDNASDFSELYEPLYLLSKGSGERKDWIFNSFNRIVNELDGNDAFKLAFAKKFGALVSTPLPEGVSAKKAAKNDKKKTKKCRKAAKKLLKLMDRAGIVRDKAITVKADELTAESYDTVGTASLTAGAVYDVLAPFWSLLIKERQYPEAKKKTSKKKASKKKAAESAEEPVAEVPVTEVPVTEVPVAEEPAAEVPVTEAPAEADGEENITEDIADAPAATVPQSKKAAKKANKADKKANKKAAKAQKKAIQKSIVVIKEKLLLAKGAVR